MSAVTRTDEHEPIAAEFLGLARQARSRMFAACKEAGQPMRALTAEVFAIADARNHTSLKSTYGHSKRPRPQPLRPETLIDVERRWLALSRANCLGRTVHRDRASLLAEDLTIIPKPSTAHSGRTTNTNCPSPLPSTA